MPILWQKQLLLRSREAQRKNKSTGRKSGAFCIKVAKTTFLIGHFHLTGFHNTYKIR